MRTHRALILRACCGLSAILLLIARAPPRRSSPGSKAAHRSARAYHAGLQYSAESRRTPSSCADGELSLLRLAEQNWARPRSKPRPGASLGIGYRYTGTDVTFDIGPAIEVLWQRKKRLGKSTEQTLIGGPFAADLYYQVTRFTGVTSPRPIISRTAITGRRHLSQRVTDLEFKDSWALLIAPMSPSGRDRRAPAEGGGGLFEIAFDKGETGFRLRRLSGSALPIIRKTSGLMSARPCIIISSEL